MIPQCGKKRNSLSAQKIFREINSLITSLVKTLLSRNFCQSSVEIFDFPAPQILREINYKNSQSSNFKSCHFYNFGD